MEIHIGIDGGGTHAMAAAVTGDGSVLTVREGGSLNENNLGRAIVREHLHALVGEVLRGNEHAANGVAILRFHLPTFLVGQLGRHCVVIRDERAADILL